MTTIVAPRALPTAWSGERVFHVSMSLAILVAVLVGFSRSFYLHALFPARPVPAEPVFVLHGIVFTAWFVLLCVQSLLVANRRTDVHRVLGVAGGVLIVAMIAVGLHGAAIAGARGFIGLPVPGWAFMIVPVVDMVTFAAFTGLALANRRDPQAHKRWMLIASIGILTAAVARWPLIQDTLNPLVFFAVTDLFLVPLVVRDWKTRGRLHPATLWGGLALIVSQPLRLVLSGTEAWHATADWLIRVLA